MSPLSDNICGSVLKASQSEKEKYENLAFQKIINGQLAVLLLAGGQGTRLGVSYPKGMYDVGLISKKSLFQLQAERLLKLQKLAEERTGQVCVDGIPWYIMTSESTVKPTKEFFEANKFFGLKRKNVVFFKQGTFPCFSFDGKILLASKFELQRAPDGNGGLYRALGREKILEDMKNRGVSYIQLYCVDNILVKVGDPIFTGFCLSRGVEVANKVVPKLFPTESVGITCKVNGNFQVVEYSEITEKASGKKHKDGSLVYSAANICIHFFTVDFLQRVVEKHEKDLVHHVAKKKISYVDTQTGETVTPNEPNGIKMEKFVFDVFRFAREDQFAVWETIRDEEFAPLKNADGASDFTAKHCRNAVYSLHRKYLKAAGVTITGSSSSGIEISPSITYSGEGLTNLVKDKVIQAPTHLSS